MGGSGFGIRCSILLVLQSLAFVGFYTIGFDKALSGACEGFLVQYDVIVVVGLGVIPS